MRLRKECKYVEKNNLLLTKFKTNNEGAECVCVCVHSHCHSVIEKTAILGPQIKFKI